MQAQPGPHWQPNRSWDTRLWWLRFRVAGVLGRAIHGPSVEIVRAARGVVEADRLRLAVVAVGGAAAAEDFDDFFRAGADAVLCGSAPMYRPNLAAEVRRLHPEW